MRPAQNDEELLLAAYDAKVEHTAFDGEGIELAMEFEWLAMECGANPSWSRERIVRYQRARKGGLATLARYGREHYRALARARWGKAPKGALPTIRDALASKESGPEAPRKTPGDREGIAA